jgi:cytochrome oxidase Cu insertion factor (SCO1/SenC/PrrC family)
VIATAPQIKRPWRGRLQFIALIAVFTIPFAGAYFWKPDRFMNTGDLVTPVRPIGDISLRTADGASIAFSELPAKWTLVYFGPAACADPCQLNLYKMRQVRLSRGRDRDRIQYLFVVTGPDGTMPPAKIVEEHPDLLVFTGSPDQIRALAEQFSINGDDPLKDLDRVYVIDPWSNFIMSYPPNADPKGMRSDFGRLLRVAAPR